MIFILLEVYILDFLKSAFQTSLDLLPAHHRVCHLAFLMQILPFSRILNLFYPKIIIRSVKFKLFSLLGSLFRLCKKSIIQTYRSLFLRLLEVYFLDLQKYDFHTSGSRYPRPPEAHHQIFRHPNTPDQKNHRYIRLHPVHRQPHSRFPDSFPPASSCVAKFLT